LKTIHNGGMIKTSLRVLLQFIGLNTHQEGCLD